MNSCPLPILLRSMSDEKCLMGVVMERGTMLVQAWGAAALNAVIWSNDLLEAASAWIDLVLGVMQ